MHSESTGGIDLKFLSKVRNTGLIQVGSPFKACRAAPNFEASGLRALATRLLERLRLAYSIKIPLGCPPRYVMGDGIDVAGVVELADRDVSLAQAPRRQLFSTPKNSAGMSKATCSILTTI